MKKRVLLELRHRSPSEVSTAAYFPAFYQRLLGANLTGRRRGGEHMAALSAGRKKCRNESKNLFSE